jgi:FkbM family methyltransferase
MEQWRLRRWLLRLADKCSLSLLDLFLTLRAPLSRDSKLALLKEMRTNASLSRRGRKSGYRAGGFSLEFQNSSNPPALYREIFLQNSAFFTPEDTDIVAPYIILGGVNVGMSVAYAKWLHPMSTIVGFEPNPATFAIAQKNVAANGMRHVVLVEAALAAEEGTIELLTDDQDLGASIVMRKQLEGATGKVEVKTDILSKYIDKDVDFLKLDIEGAELQVLKECEGKLPLVKRLLIEYHFVSDNTENSLSEILVLLERNNFLYSIRRSMNYDIIFPTAPIESLRAEQSLDIYAKRRDLS